MVFNATFNNISAISVVFSGYFVSSTNKTYRHEILLKVALNTMITPTQTIKGPSRSQSYGWFGFMVFNATFSNISAISWRSVLLVEETGGHGENHRSVANHWQTLSHNVVHLTLSGIRTHNIISDNHWLYR